jgi:hypothetical protein
VGRDDSKLSHFRDGNLVDKVQGSNGTSSNAKHREQNIEIKHSRAQAEEDKQKDKITGAHAKKQKKGLKKLAALEPTS